MTELRDDFPIGPDPTFNPNLFSEDEEEQNSGMQEEKHHKCSRFKVNFCCFCWGLSELLQSEHR